MEKKILTHALIHLSESMVNGSYKKQALASKDVGPAEIGRAVRGLGTRRIDLAVAACEPLPSPSPDITEALATLTPPAAAPSATHTPYPTPGQTQPHPFFMRGSSHGIFQFNLLSNRKTKQ